MTTDPHFDREYEWEMLCKKNYKMGGEREETERKKKKKIGKHMKEGRDK